MGGGESGRPSLGQAASISDVVTAGQGMGWGWGVTEEELFPGQEDPADLKGEQEGERGRTQEGLHPAACSQETDLGASSSH